MNAINTTRQFKSKSNNIYITWINGKLVCQTDIDFWKNFRLYPYFIKTHQNMADTDSGKGTNLIKEGEQMFLFLHFEQTQTF